MDDEVAEIELLEQNLNKTRQISQRMTSILSSFDTRLIRLERSILPLYQSTQVLTKRSTNIESALLKIDDLATTQEGLASEEALILRGPQANSLKTYIDAVERLNAGIAFKSSERDTSDTARLVETAAKKLTQLYTKLVAEASSGSAPGGASEFSLSPFPSSQLSTLKTVVAFLRTLPLPATHPSHPAAQAIGGTLREAQRGYGEMRGAWAKKCLEVYGKRAVERAETLDGVQAGREFGRWVGNVILVGETERELLADLAPLPARDQLTPTYTALLTPSITLFTTQLSTLTALIKRALHKHTFLALSTFSALSDYQLQWDETMSRGAGRRENELKEGLHSLRGVCLRSFPEFLADVKMAGIPKAGVEVGAGLADITVHTVQYLERIPDVQEAVGSALVTLGDGNWKMGDGVQVNKGPKLGEGDEGQIVEHFVYDVIQTTITSLNALTKTSRRPPIAAVFLLNNASHLRTHLLASSTSTIDTLLSKPTRDLLNSTFRTAKAGYFDANFMPLMQALADDPRGDKASKSGVKERFTRFYDLLEEAVERHKIARVLGEDEDGREQVADEVVKLVVPSLQRFMNKNREKEFSKNPQKYIKLSPDEVESQLRGLFS